MQLSELAEQLDKGAFSERVIWRRMKSNCGIARSQMLDVTRLLYDTSISIEGHYISTKVDGSLP